MHCEPSALLLCVEQQKLFLNTQFYIVYFEYNFLILKLEYTQNIQLITQLHKIQTEEALMKRCFRNGLYPWRQIIKYFLYRCVLSMLGQIARPS